ncbi:methyl-accepting chemotaxis protein [Shewanella sp. Arc9-LZ]|jgi:methyl-accepting chemotaxis protein|uniref:methyl-accepting chemotaxis protein n=1 Tax=Shewanella sp. Arc9-LZ TaxID=2698686 RepID=UPI00137BB164|nr:methyl-accepting chemotaxis protein [Shewanella sp. Arc9-LZ]QHS13756.1 methyl-accepting chemotaxis protein [Shewanella sp. Arc9-LZ]
MNPINMLFRKTTIANRLLGMLALAIIATVIVFWFSLTRVENVLINEKEAKLNALVDIATTIADKYYQDAQSGSLSEDEAKVMALAAIDKLRYSGNEYYFSIDTQGTMIQHAFAKQLVNTKVLAMQDPNGVKLFEQMIQRTEQQDSARVDYMWNKPQQEQPSPKMSVVKRFRPWGWIIGTGIYVDDIQNDKNQFISQYLLLLALVWLPVILLLFFIIRSISGPMIETISAFKNIAKGEGDLTLRLSEEGNDELKQIAHHFNAFIDKIQKVIISVSHSVDESSRLAQNMSTIAQQANQISSNVQAETENVATAINEMSMTASEVASNAQLAADSTHHADKEADKSANVVDNAMKKISELSSELAATEEVAKGLQVSSSKIGQILDVIVGIADQTNLLALNAAIEAARAGEAGRGFAVVADEVRTLASRTQASTSEINLIIDAIRSAIDSVNASVARAKVKSSETVNETQQVVVALENIKSSIEQISQMNVQIAAATEEQSTVIGELNMNITRINDMSLENRTQNELINKGSMDIEQGAIQLHQLVDQFKVK